MGPDQVPALLICPEATGRHPAAILQHGFGAEKSDLLPFGAALAAFGFVVLLADAWGHGERLPTSGPTWRTETSADYFVDVVRHTAADLSAGVSTLLERPDVRSDAVLVGGFSMGAITALLVGAEDPRVAGVVSLAGSPLPDILDITRLGSHSPGDAARTYAHAH